VVKAGLQWKTRLVKHLHKSDQSLAFKIVQYAMQIHAAGGFPGAAAGDFFLFIQPEALLTALGNARADKNFQLFLVHHPVLFNFSQQ
jgi:hypothetical protein